MAVINSFFLVLSLYLRILCIILWLFVVFAFAFSCWKSFISSLVYCTMFFNKHFRSPKIRFRRLLDYLHYLSFGEILAIGPFFQNCIKVFEFYFYFLSIRRNSIHVFTTAQLIVVTQVTHSHIDC